MPPLRNNRSGLTSPELDETPLQSPVSETSDFGSETETEPEPATSLQFLQTEKQRDFLEAIASLRKHGVDDVISLPQVVVCGDQSAGKSSVLEAITGIPFPSTDGLYTRFATEINLRYAVTNSITVSINPNNYTESEKEQTTRFKRVIKDFHELEKIMREAMKEMSISTEDDQEENKERSSPLFSRDALSIEYQGPGCPQLTVVDLPGLLGTDTLTGTLADVELVNEITQHYIEQPRTIILPVITAVADLATHSILTRSRAVDPDGQRTLGIITKPDLTVPNSDRESSYVDLILNNDQIHLDLGWHVVKNKKPDEAGATLEERNSSETAFFRESTWSCLPKDKVGIDSLVTRLSHVLFEHIKQQLPKLQEKIDSKLSETRFELNKHGKSRLSSRECKEYLTKLSLECYGISKAAVDGHYEGKYFSSDDHEFSLSSQSSITRTRAVVQSLNSSFAGSIRRNGQKYRVVMSEEDDGSEFYSEFFGCNDGPGMEKSPILFTKDEAMSWVKKALRRMRGKDLVGNFKPLLIGELYWELSEKWESLATDHVKVVADACGRFLKGLIRDKCSLNAEARIWNSKIQDELNSRRNAATLELKLLLEDERSYPINYNDDYTDTINKRRTERQQKSLLRCIEIATTFKFGEKEGLNRQVDPKKAVAEYAKEIDLNKENFECEEILGGVFVLYRIQQEKFIANVTTQVIERHIVRGLENIFSPVYVSGLKNKEAQEMAREPFEIQAKRAYLTDQIKKLEDGKKAFRKFMV